MTTAIETPSEYRDLPLAVLVESKTTPRRVFEDAALKELASSIRTQGVVSLRCWYGPWTNTASRSSPEPGATAPRRWRTWPPCPSAS